MDLSNLKPAKGSVKKSRRLGRDRVPEKEEHLQGGIREPSSGLDIKRRSDLKVARCLCRDVFRNTALRA